jgi:hypothetical protein
VVLNRKEGQRYDATSGDPTFSPDSRHIAYMAAIGEKCFVVIDKNEGKQYDNIISIGSGRIVYDSVDSLHYLTVQNSCLYLVEERISQ